MSFTIFGWGDTATGGAGGVPVEINNLNNSGTGSLRAFLEDDAGDGTRYAVFSDDFPTAGIINLNSEIRIVGNVTLDCVSAGKWIIFARDRLRVMEDNTIIRGVQGMIGLDANNPGNADGASIGNPDDTRIENVVFDRCAFCWSIDEILTAWGPHRYVTISHCQFFEPLEDAGHPEQPNHAFAVLLGGKDGNGPSHVSLLWNMFAHADDRHPQGKDNLAECEMIGNVIYNFKNKGMAFLGGAQVDTINNIVINGPMTTNPDRQLFVRQGSTDVYSSGNKSMLPNGTFEPIQVTTQDGGNISNTMLGTPKTTSYPAAGQDTFDYVMANAGANLDNPHSLRIKYHVLNRIGPSDLITKPREAISHTGSAIGGSNDDRAYNEYTFPPELNPIGSGNPDPDPVEPVEFEVFKTDGDLNTTFRVPLEPGEYDLQIQQRNVKGRGARSSPKIVVTSLAAAAPVLTLVNDNLDQDPAEFVFTTDTDGDVTWDFHTSITPPPAGTGNLGTGGAAVTSGENTITVDLSPYPGTGFLHFRQGTSNVLTSQQLTVAPPASAIEAAVNASAGTAFYMATDDPARLYETEALSNTISGNGAPVGGVDSLHGNVDMLQATGSNRPTWDQSAGLLASSGFGFLEAAVSFTGTTYLAMVVQTGDSTFFTFGGDENNEYLAATAESDTNPSENNAGSPTYRVNGQTVANLRTALWAALDTDQKLVLEVIGADLTGWTKLMATQRLTQTSAIIKYGDLVALQTPSTQVQSDIRAELTAKHSIT